MATDDEIVACLQLINSARIGAVKFHQLVTRFGTIQQAVQQLPVDVLYPIARAEAELKRAQKTGAELVMFDDPFYPANLKLIENPPPLLYVLGNKECLNTPHSAAIVGARNATIQGRKTASRIAFELTEAGVMVVSGMARGIDGAAHKGAMYACNQQGGTVAVLGSGVDVPYPEENTDLYRQIANQGAVVSEFPLGTLPSATNFPRRNKIVAALAQVTLVVEATLKSGSLITAGIAAEFGRKVLAIPGNPAEGRAEGPNRLIKDGAVLVENAADVLQVLAKLAPMSTAPKQERRPRQKDLFAPVLRMDLCPENDGKTKIIDYLNPDGVYVDEIIRASHQDPAEVAYELLELEMNGRITRLPGNRVALIK